MAETQLRSGMTVVSETPTGNGKRAGIVFLHERYGLTQNTRDLARRGAAEGFVTCAPDLYHRFDVDKDAVARGDERVAMGEQSEEETLSDLDDAVAFLRDRDDVDGAKIGIVGFCMSGRLPILYAARRGDAAAIVVYYGAVGGRRPGTEDSLDPDLTAMIPDVFCPLLGLFGELDHSHSIDNIRLFRNELEAAGKSFDIRVYRDAPHGWMNDMMPGRYRSEAAAAAWETTISFFRTTLNGGWDNSRRLARFESDVSVDYDFSKNRRWE